MSEAPKFTPGPWQYRPDDNDDWGVVKAGKLFICQARAENARDVDALNRHRKAGTDPWEANAQLIAAAPELYEALKAAERELCTAAGRLGYLGDLDHADDCRLRAEAIRSALAKAEGRS